MNRTTTEYRTQPAGRLTARGKRGVMLIIALGALAVFALLVLAFSGAIRSRRLAARGSIDDIRAQHLLYAALARSVSHISQSMTNTVYPVWDDGVALASPGTSICADILPPELLDAIPTSLRADVSGVGAHWNYAVDSTGATNGRLAWIAVNCSGLLDANVVGGSPRTVSTNVTELDLDGLPDLTDTAETFYNSRERHRRYESVDELSRINSNCLARPVSDLFVYSYDPGRDAYYTSLADLGNPSAVFSNKLCVNMTPSDPTRFQLLLDTFSAAGFADAESLAWNVVNYIDEDRIAQCDESEPWLSSRISEAVPLINEVVIRDASNQMYEVAVELWFPFLPAEVTPADGFSLECGIFSNATSQALLEAGSLPGWSFRTNITDMAYGGPTEFVIARSPADKLISESNLTSTVWFMARVLQSNTVVGQVWDAAPVPFNTAGAWSVDDPRANGVQGEWTPQAETLGALNTNCSAWADADHGQGLPIFHRDGAMVSIGELGHIFTPTPAYSNWSNIDLLTTNAGRLMDRLTVRATNTASHGLVAIGTPNAIVSATLFYGMPIGYSNEHTVDADTAMQTGRTIATNGPYQSFSDLLILNAPALRACATNTMDTVPISDILREDPLRNIVELVTFRQNLFTIVLIAEALGSSGHAAVARKQAVAVLYRDAYTGRTFLRSLRMLKD